MIASEPSAGDEQTELGAEPGPEHGVEPDTWNHRASVHRSRTALATKIATMTTRMTTHHEARKRPGRRPPSGLSGPTGRGRRGGLPRAPRRGFGLRRRSSSRKSSQHVAHRLTMLPPSEAFHGTAKRGEDRLGQLVGSHRGRARRLEPECCPNRKGRTPWAGRAVRRDQHRQRAAGAARHPRDQPGQRARQRRPETRERRIRRRAGSWRDIVELITPSPSATHMSAIHQPV